MVNLSPLVVDHLGETDRREGDRNAAHKLGRGVGRDVYGNGALQGEAVG